MNQLILGDNLEIMRRTKSESGFTGFAEFIGFLKFIFFDVDKSK